MKKFTRLSEDLRKWFNPSHPEGGWKRINSKGEAIGPCAREPGEGKPKCMSNEKRASLSKKERASAVRAKRRHDPNPERKGKPINVSNFGKGKLSEDMEQLDEKNVPTSPEKWARAKAMAKSKFDVYPSAYANGWAAKKYKEMGGGWKSVSEAKEEPPFDKPYKKSEDTTTDKSGAKHSQYSKVRHLARMAAKKQMDNLKKPVKEETEQVDEGLGDVVKKVKSAKNLAKFHYNYAKKIFKNPDAEISQQEISKMRKSHGLGEEVEQIDEGRPSQRHPLEGHAYHKKTDAELKYIAKDAHEAAENMKGHNTTAENKYRDQVNDASSVLHFRKTSGTPDWYKKKYGHMKEEKENDTEEKNEMVLSQLHFMQYACQEIIDYINKGGEVEEWYQVKVAKSFSEFESLHAFMEGEKRRKGMVKEGVEQIDELSTDLLGRYKKAAGAQASAANKTGDVAKGNKRFSGIMKATLKQFKNDAKKRVDEQHREEGRFKPVVPQKVPNVSVANSAKKAQMTKSATKTAVVKDKYEPNPELTTTLTKNV